MRDINQVSFPSDVGDSATALDLKLDVFLSNLLKLQLSKKLSFSYEKNKFACIYLYSVKNSLIIFYLKMNDWFQGYENICV